MKLFPISFNFIFNYVKLYLKFMIFFCLLKIIIPLNRDLTNNVATNKAYAHYMLGVCNLRVWVSRMASECCLHVWGCQIAWKLLALTSKTVICSCTYPVLAGRTF